MTEPEAAIREFVSGGRQRVDGWFARVDAEIFRIILTAQNDRGLKGSVAEIGIHHGKSFIALCLCLKDDERAYAIDVFEAQEHNLDSSGKGNRSRFESNLKKFGVQKDRVTIDTRPSEQVGSSDILDAADPVRFFSVDGGHWAEVVKSDLTLAESTISEHGVIALDDFHRFEWPEVSKGLWEWEQQKEKDLVPFAIGYNKLYLCQSSWVGFYQKKCVEDAFVRHFLWKWVTLSGHEIPIFNRFVVPEMGCRRGTGLYFQSFAPGLFVFMMMLKIKSKKIGTSIRSIFKL